MELYVLISMLEEFVRTIKCVSVLSILFEVSNQSSYFPLSEIIRNLSTRLTRLI